MKKKKILITLLLMLTLSSNILSVSAVSFYKNYPTNASTNPKTTEDNIITKFRTYNGKLQYRRWNDTKKVWVDPYWIDC